MLCSRCFSPSMFVFCALLLCGTALASSQDPFEPGRVIDGRAILDMGWGDNMCALTFDDGPVRIRPGCWTCCAKGESRPRFCGRQTAEDAPGVDPAHAG